jgi:hypothetical protein
LTKYFHRELLSVAALVAWAGIAVMPASASLLYIQDPNYESGVSSQNDTTGGFGHFSTTYDNFTLTATSDITSVEWYGSYFNPPTQGTITGFTVDFYADDSGIPGAVLGSTGDVAGNAGETFVTNDDGGDPTYLYSLDTTFVALAGTQYWLSIVPDLGFPPQWGWETGTGGDGAAYQCFLGTCAATTSDQAFALFGGSPVTGTTPEPGAVLLLVTALAVILPKVRKKVV